MGGVAVAIYTMVPVSMMQPRCIEVNSKVWQPEQYIRIDAGAWGLGLSGGGGGRGTGAPILAPDLAPILAPIPQQLSSMHSPARAFYSVSL
jgi:hypothetical protein